MGKFDKIYIQEAFKAYLESKGGKSQAWLAKMTGITQQTINNMCRGSLGTEKNRDIIFDFMKTDLLSFLKMGEREYNQKHGITKFQKENDEPHIKIDKFQDQKRALRINSKLVHAESIELRSLDKIEKLIDLEIEELEERKGEEERNKTSTGA